MQVGGLLEDCHMSGIRERTEVYIFAVFAMFHYNVCNSQHKIMCVQNV